ncbi:glycosyltransferase family 2 protein [Lutibacter sp. HS1-25]|uniref:glycosyltransferase family 2 protein n=1 Tax=Lutibacter sp. HS1-25 TaxID=2485000 RepID=UPI001F0B7DF8|nr:glycosyltransferase family 2 protein [Lutibacter sp. HS1-25]
MNNLIDISVVIVNYNVKYFLEQCILSVQSASKGLSVEIIVVDNNSTDGSCEMLQQKYADLKLILNKENTGFSKANNQGVAIAKGAYVLILNPDTVIAEDTLSLILGFAKSKQNLGILGVKLIDGSGNFLPESKRGIPTPKVSFNKLFGFSSKQAGKYYATNLNQNETGEVAILVGAFMLLKKAIYLEVEGFDEAYFMYGEDIDLSYKVLKKGYKNYYYANTQVIHYKGESTKKDIKYLRHFHGAMKIFYRKHFKLNPIYDFVMGIGIELWFFMKFLNFVRQKESNRQIDKILYLGEDKQVVDYLNENYTLINNDLAADFTQIKSTIKSNKVEGVVLDNNTISNKKIIQTLEALKNENTVFKIRPKSTNFLIGSNCAVKRGKVEILD